MNIYLGNITFNQVRDKLGYQLTDEDKVLWDKYHNEQADLSGMESSFHVFEIPLSMHFKGNAAKKAPDGDYIIMDIDENGKIDEWNFDIDDFQED
jgi:hypothetical protein